MKLKRLLSMATAVALTMGICTYVKNPEKETVSAAGTGKYNYGEVLQNSLFFYEVQQAGPLPEWNQVTWRADATMNDEVLGGWYDAGDHVKFNLPMAYSATTLNWGLIEYGKNIDADLKKRLQLNIQFALDYLVDCDRGETIVYQIGNGTADHKWWGSPELIELEMKRPAYTGKNLSTVEGEMAAALASGYIAMKDDYPEKAAKYLEKAIHYFTLADTNRSDTDYVEANDYYKSWSGFYDELLFASNWLYKATGEQSWLTKAEEYISHMGNESQTTQKSFSWPYCWDDVSQGAYLLYAQNTGKQEWIDQVKKHLDWMQGKDVTMSNGGTKSGAKSLSDGLALVGDNWATIRYANNAAFIANVAIDTLPFDEAYKTQVTAFAEKQTNYALGDNSSNFSYMIGFGDKYPQYPHHRAAYGDWLDSNGSNAHITANGYSHTLIGAVVGGPNSSGVYNDTQADFQANEVATDYNAAFTSNVLKLLSKYGGSPDPNFPPIEQPTRNEIYVEAGMNGQGNFFTPIVILAKNHSAWPARALQSPTFRYFIDLSEVFAAGFTENDVFTKVDYERYGSGTDSNGLAVSPLQISAHPIKYKDNIYYIELSYPDSPSVFAPMGQEQHELQMQFRFGIPDGSPAGSWDPNNDYSYSSVKDGTKEKPALCDNICIYDGEELIWGTEPDGKKPTGEITTPPGQIGDGTKPTKPTTPTTTETTPTTAPTVSAPTETTPPVSNSSTTPIDPNVVIGDIDDDGDITTADLIILAKTLANRMQLSDKQKIAANCHSNPAINADDLLAMIKYLVNTTLVLPLE